MKEATGELNMTVITVLAIVAVAGIFYALVWPSIKDSIQRNTRCANAMCTGTCTNGVQTCYYIPEGQADATSGTTITCPCQATATKK